MKTVIIGTMMILSIFFGQARYAVAQEPAMRDSIKVFIDCGDCDFDHIRQNVTFLNYVYDRKDADIHVLITNQDTGGGKEYQLRL